MNKLTRLSCEFRSWALGRDLFDSTDLYAECLRLNEQIMNICQEMKRALMKEVNVRSGQEETKLLHSAVSQHGSAKKEVQEAQSACFNMHSAWRNFLSQSAQENLRSCKTAVGVEGKDDTSMTRCRRSQTQRNRNHSRKTNCRQLQGPPLQPWPCCLSNLAK